MGPDWIRCLSRVHAVQEFKTAMMALDTVLLEEQQRKLLTESLPLVREWSARELDSALVDAHDPVMDAVGLVERTSKKLKALHAVHMNMSS